MSQKEIIANCGTSETRVAVSEDGQLQEIFIERESSRGTAGNIYKGRVSRVLPGMQSAFVNIGLERRLPLRLRRAVEHRRLLGLAR